MKIYHDAKTDCQSIKEKWLESLEFDTDLSKLEQLETSLALAEKHIIRHWYDHIFNCGFRCERDSSIAQDQMTHILTMLRETILIPSTSPAQIDISRGIPALLSSTTLAHKFTILILMDQRQRILPIQPLENNTIAAHGMPSGLNMRHDTSRPKYPGLERAPGVATTNRRDRERERERRNRSQTTAKTNTEYNMMMGGPFLPLSFSLLDLDRPIDQPIASRTRDGSSTQPPDRTGEPPVPYFPDGQLEALGK